ncbi:MAG TPA: hypothetical protein VHW60_04985 [Caulobacteraceae bacterium]|nr:hypothetical protein [Caulobacteraceae bacterium]
MLAEQLWQEWRARRAAAAIEPVMRFSREGLVVGAGTVLATADASGGEVALAADQRRLQALLAAAHLRPAEPGALIHLRKAAHCWGRGEVVLADIHLALSGVSRLRRPEVDAQRLFLAERLMQEGFEPDVILTVADFM